MYIGSDNRDLPIRTWQNYIFGPHRKDVGFSIDLKDGRGATKFSDLDPERIRDLREYPIPTIEIALNENTQLDEIISLFVDINQYGAKVTRVNIVRAMKRKDPLLKDVYSLIAEKQKRRQDVFTRRKKTPFAVVLKKLQIIGSVSDADAQADRMWEKLFELTLFVRSGGVHRKPTEILKTFIRTTITEEKRLTKIERSKLTNVFVFLRDAYSKSELSTTRLATDQTHFYTMVTALLDGAWDISSDALSAKLVKKLVAFGKTIASRIVSNAEVGRYLSLSSKQTTDAEKRKDRQKLFIDIVNNL